MNAHKKRMPAEWEKHASTWIAWPHEESDWPGKFPTIDWVYAEIVRTISSYELVNVICRDESERARIAKILSMSMVAATGFRLHTLQTDRSWLRDSGPTAIFNSAGKVEWVKWKFNAWAKYDNYHKDLSVPQLVAKVSGKPITTAIRADNQSPFVLEGGAIETDGEGTLLVSEECLLSNIQERNPGFQRADYEKAFLEHLGITKTVWVNRGCEGDDTHGHIDDIARFYAPGRVLLAYEADPSDPNHEYSEENYQRLISACDAQGRILNVTKLPMPRRIEFDGQRLPASYANFYIANGLVVVPTFNDENDLEALRIIRECFSDRKVIGISCVDLILGLGTLHCLTQQEPAELA